LGATPLTSPPKNPLHMSPKFPGPIFFPSHYPSPFGFCWSGFSFLFRLGFFSSCVLGNYASFCLSILFFWCCNNEISSLFLHGLKGPPPPFLFGTRGLLAFFGPRQHAGAPPFHSFGKWDTVLRVSPGPRGGFWASGRGRCPRGFSGASRLGWWGGGG